MKGVERTNTVIVRNFLQRQGEREEMRRDSNVIKVDRGRNCYSCRGFGHIMQNYRNPEILDQGRRIEYGNNRNSMNNLKEEDNLVVLD